MWLRLVLCLLLSMALWHPRPAQAEPWLGTVGDSLSEPYAEVAPFLFDGFLRPAQPGWPFLGTPVVASPTPANWVDQLIEHRASELAVDNYALGGADTATLLATNQHGLAAAQAASEIGAGNDAFVSLGIGTNNFLPFGFPGQVNTYRGITLGCISLTSCPTAFTGSNGNAYTSVQTYVGDVLTEFAAALSVVRGSGAEAVVLGPASWSAFPGTVLSTGLAPSAIIDDAVDLLVEGQRQEALALGLPFVDLQALLEAFPGLQIGGLGLLTGHPAAGTRDPRHWFLPDGIHPDTIASGLVANAMMSAMNARGAGLTLFSDDEILGFAGLSPDAGWDGANVDVSPFVTVPEPRAGLLLGAAALLAAARALRKVRIRSRA